MEPSIETGSVVRCALPGLPMAVERMEGDAAVCTWWNGSTFHTAEFRVRDLEPSEPLERE